MDKRLSKINEHQDISTEWAGLIKPKQAQGSQALSTQRTWDKKKCKEKKKKYDNI